MSDGHTTKVNTKSLELLKIVEYYTAEFMKNNTHIGGGTYIHIHKNAHE